MNKKPRAKATSHAKPKAPKAKTEPTPGQIQNTVKNGLAEAIGFSGAGSGFPFNQGTPFSEQVSNVNTIFKNLRWYLISNMRQVLSEAYVELGLVQTICDVPVDDALRGGIDIKSKQLDENQILDLKAKMDREDDCGVAGQAAKWNRLFGGAGIIIITNQDPETELNVNAITKDTPLEFRAVDMWELFWNMQNTEGYDAELQMTEYEFYDYYSKRLHISRVMKLTGLTAPSFIRPRLRGWGFSVVEKLVRSINQYLKATDLGFEVLDEFKLDVYKIKNLVNTLMSPGGDQAIQQRVQMANWQKNYQNALVMDVEDEFDHKQLSFAGLAEAMAGIRMQIASDMRMPLTKLFGISAAGFNSGEDDLETYNSMVESEIRGKLKYDILRIAELRSQQLFGFIPDDITISFKPLRVMTSEQEENVKNAKFNRLLAAKNAGEITRFEFREGINRDELLGITLDTAGDSLNPDDPDAATLIAGEDAQVGQDPGQDRAPSEKTIGGDEEHDRKQAKAVPMSPSEKTDAPEGPVAKTQKNESGRFWNTFAKIIGPKNSSDYDKAAYEFDGGDAQIDPRRELFFKNPANVDEALWSKAKEASKEAFGEEKWQFITWKYKQLGGHFQEQPHAE